ncbi:hypothetical protein D3C72_2337210 [compost metagenome]
MRQLGPGQDREQLSRQMAARAHARGPIGDGPGLFSRRRQQVIDAGDWGLLRNHQHILIACNLADRRQVRDRIVRRLLI